MSMGQERGSMTLREFCSRHRKVALAYSGGCDSSYLFSELVNAGVDVKAYLVMTAFQPEFELKDAHRMADLLGADLEVIEADILVEKEICANPHDRCYRCKRFIFGTIIRHMAEEGYEILVDGTNASDDPSRRPGFKALSELAVLSPLRMADLSKEQIRQASSEKGLFTAEKPSFSCYATKIEHGTRITGVALSEVAQRLGRA